MMSESNALKVIHQEIVSLKELYGDVRKITEDEIKMFFDSLFWAYLDLRFIINEKKSKKPPREKYLPKIKRSQAISILREEFTTLKGNMAKMKDIPYEISRYSDALETSIKTLENIKSRSLENREKYAEIRVGTTM